MSPSTQGDYIADLLAIITAATELPGGLFEVEVPDGSGAYVSRKLTTEQLVDYLQTQSPAPALTTTQPLATAQTNLANGQPHGGKGVQHFLVGDWNASGANNQMVAVHASDEVRFRTNGTLYRDGQAHDVVVDVAAGTAVALLEQHTQQLATIAVKDSAVYGYLELGGQPVGYNSLDAALADTRRRTFLRFNTANLAITTSNMGAGTYYVNGEGATITLGENAIWTLPGDDIGTLYQENMYLAGSQGSRVNLLTSAAASTPTALLPRLDGHYACALWLLNGGAIVLSGYYLSLNGTGTVYALEPFQCDTVAAGVTITKISAGTVKTVNGTAADAAGNVVLASLDIHGYSEAKRQQVFTQLFTTPSQFKAVDVPLSGDQSTGLGSQIPDFSNGDLYTLLADPDNPMPDPQNAAKTIGTPTWLRTSQA